MERICGTTGPRERRLAKIQKKLWFVMTVGQRVWRLARMQETLKEIVGRDDNWIVRTARTLEALKRNVGCDVHPEWRECWKIFTERNCGLWWSSSGGHAGNME
jgi:hypothetical protein